MHDFYTLCGLIFCALRHLQPLFQQHSPSRSMIFRLNPAYFPLIFVPKILRMLPLKFLQPSFLFINSSSSCIFLQCIFLHPLLHLLHLPPASLLQNLLFAHFSQKVSFGRKILTLAPKDVFLQKNSYNHQKPIFVTPKHFSLSLFCNIISERYSPLLPIDVSPTYKRNPPTNANITLHQLEDCFFLL